MLKILQFLSFVLVILSCNNNNNTKLNTSIKDQKVFQVRKMVIPTWTRNANIYEVNIRQYTKEGTFKAFQEHLPRLQKMGVTTFWFMPIHPIGFEKRKGALGSPYSIADFTKVNPDLGTFEELKELVSEIHQLRMHVILDWVGNHSSWDHAWISNHPEWYTKAGDTITHPIGDDGNPTDWYDVADLNYDLEPMRNTMLESMKFWLRSIDADGFRCDMADLIPNSFWQEVRPSLEAIRPIFMLAEAEGNVNHFETCFQANYGWKLYHLLNQIAKGKADANDIEQYLLADRSKHPQGYYHLNFITNHDENAWAGSAKERLGPATEAMAVIAFTFEGIPLLYSGQEIGLDRRLSFFEKDQIVWKASPLEEFYTKLLQLKTYNKGLWNGVFGGKMVRITEEAEVYAYKRTQDDNTVVTIVNCTDQQVKTTISENIRSLTDLFTGKDYNLKKGDTLTLDAWQYLVLANPSIIL